MDEEKVKMMIDLRIQNYFDHYLKEVLPGILETQKQTCPYGKQISKIKWLLIGGSIAAGITIPIFGRAMLSALFRI